MYARAGIAQYVIVNLPDLCIELYDQPVPNEARYARKEVRRSGEAFELRLPDGTLRVDAARVLP